MGLAKSFLKKLPMEWMYPLVAIALVVGVIAYLQRDLLQLLPQAPPEEFIPLFINIGVVALLLYLRRIYRKVRDFLTPGTMIFWTIVIQLILYLAWLKFT